MGIGRPATGYSGGLAPRREVAKGGGMEQRVEYEPPRVEDLGTLVELTRAVDLAGADDGGHGQSLRT